MKTKLPGVLAVIVALVGIGLVVHAHAQGQGKKSSGTVGLEGLKLNKDTKAALLEILAVYRDQIASLQMVQPPIGTILAWVGDPRTLPANWQICDGSPLKDPASPLKNSVCKDGRVPNLNGKFLRGTVHVSELLKEGGHAQQLLKVQLPVNLETHYSWRKDNVFAHGPAGGDPRTFGAVVTGSNRIWLGQIDMARLGVRGNTGEQSYAIATIPPFSGTYYIILINK